MKADLTNINHYPVEKLLFTLREYDDLVFRDNLFDLRYFPKYQNNCEKLLESSGIDFSTKSYEDIYDFCDILLKQLVEDNYIKKWTQNDSVCIGDADGDKTIHTITHRSYTLTNTGLDLVLKVEAHNDAERRHNDTHKHNTLMRWIAGSSFLLSLVAVCVSAYLAYIANQNMQVNQQRLEIQQQQIQVLSDKVKEELSTKQPAKVEPTKVEPTKVESSKPQL